VSRLTRWLQTGAKAEIVPVQVIGNYFHPIKHGLCEEVIGLTKNRCMIFDSSISEWVHFSSSSADINVAGRDVIHFRSLEATSGLATGGLEMPQGGDIGASPPQEASASRRKRLSSHDLRTEGIKKAKATPVRCHSPAKITIHLFVQAGVNDHSRPRW
jgi:hypothetical protein